MKLVVVTEKVGKGWCANCYEEDNENTPVGNGGGKNSEAAAGSGAIGDYFRRLRMANE